MKNPYRFSSRLIRQNDGFALIATISLMTLLAILAIGLLNLSSVTVRSASQNDSDTEARANAQMALLLAIGQLQNQLGPDSRISAPHDAGNVATGGQPRWTAVYDAWKWNANPATAETPSTRTPQFRGWLVTDSNQAGGMPSTGEFIRMVSSKSLSATAKPEDQVSVPMLAVNNGKRQGRMGWWTTDESIKAKINAGGETPATSKPLFDSQSPRFVGHKAVTELAGFDWLPGQRSTAVSTAAVNLAANLGTSGLGLLNHDVTVHSNGVIADVRGGHLKRDLSNLLSRPITDLIQKPLFIADGRINRFQINADGSFSNATGWPASNGSGANRWGINLEELHLFHEIHREVDWSTGSPRLLVKNSNADIMNDRFFIYSSPLLEALSQILSFMASPEPGTSPTTYRLDGMVNSVVCLANPNDIPIVWPSSVEFRARSTGLPYRPRWNIIRTPPARPNFTHTVQPINSPFFSSSIRGGFTVEAGEVAVFGASTTNQQARGAILTRGYVPSGGVMIRDQDWDQDNVPDSSSGLRATGLLPSDTMGVTMVPAPASMRRIVN